MSGKQSIALNLALGSKFVMTSPIALFKIYFDARVQSRSGGGSTEGGAGGGDGGGDGRRRLQTLRLVPAEVLRGVQHPPRQRQLDIEPADADGRRQHPGHQGGHARSGPLLCGTAPAGRRPGYRGRGRRSGRGLRRHPLPLLLLDELQPGGLRLAHRAYPERAVPTQRRARAASDLRIRACAHRPPCGAAGQLRGGGAVWGAGRPR